MGHSGPQIRRRRIWSDEIWKGSTRRYRRLVDAVTNARAVATVDQQRVEAVDNVVIEPTPTAGLGCAVVEQRTFNFEATVFGERLGDVHDHEIGEQQGGERVVAIRIQRPVGLAVERIKECQIGVQPRPVGAEIVLRQVEGIFLVEEIADFEVSIHSVERLWPT